MHSTKNNVLKINSRSAKTVLIWITGAHAQAVKQSSVFQKANPELNSRPGSGPSGPARHTGPDRADPVRPRLNDGNAAMSSATQRRRCGGDVAKSSCCENGAGNLSATL